MEEFSRSQQQQRRTGKGFVLETVWVDCRADKQEDMDCQETSIKVRMVSSILFYIDTRNVLTILCFPTRADVCFIFYVMSCIRY